MKKIFEPIVTFQDPSWSLSSMGGSESSCFNGNVQVIKYKITVEIVEEPIEVIHSRLQTLWDNSTNWHHCEPLKKEASKYGYALKGSMGGKARK